MCIGLGKGVTWDRKVKRQLLYATASPTIVLFKFEIW